MSLTKGWFARRGCALLAIMCGLAGVRSARAADPSPQQGLERVTAKQDRQPRGLEGVGLTPEQVNAAIDKGSKALWELIREKDLKDSNYKFGYLPEHSLSALALVHAGAHKKI